MHKMPTVGRGDNQHRRTRVHAEEEEAGKEGEPREGGRAKEGLRHGRG